MNKGDIVTFEYDHHADNIETVTGIIDGNVDREVYWRVLSFDPSGIWVDDYVHCKALSKVPDQQAMLWMLENL